MQNGLTAYRLNILRLLANYRFLTTQQVHQLAKRNQLRYTQADLLWLKQQKMIIGDALEPAKGEASEYCWLLRLAGVRQVEKVDRVKLNYGKHYGRRPDRERLEFRTTELELEQQVRRAGWNLIKPQTYNRIKPLPAKTPQYYQLCQAMTVLHAAKSGIQLSRLDREGAHTLGAPLKANDYVAYSPDQTRAIVFILCPPRAGAIFWETRIKRYELLAKQGIGVMGVFDTKERQHSHKELLAEHSFKAILVSNVEKGLVGIGGKA